MIKVSAVKCRKHPRYQAKRWPTEDCDACRRLWEARNPFPHANAEPHRMLMAWLKTASNSEIMALSVRAGIYDKHGNLTKWYR